MRTILFDPITQREVTNNNLFEIIDSSDEWARGSYICDSYEIVDDLEGQLWLLSSYTIKDRYGKDQLMMSKTPIPEDRFIWKEVLDPEPEWAREYSKELNHINDALGRLKIYTEYYCTRGKIAKAINKDKQQFIDDLAMLRKWLKIALIETKQIKVKKKENTEK